MLVIFFGGDEFLWFQVPALVKGPHFACIHILFVDHFLSLGGQDTTVLYSLANAWH